MTNFNGINPWINTLNYLQSVNQQTKAGTINQNQDLQNTNPNILLDALSNKPVIFDNIPQIQQIAAEDILKMNNEIVQKYLQSLLDFPETFEKFIQNANIKNDIQGYQFLKIFVENMLNNKELSQLLNQNSNAAIQKLLSVITETLKFNSSDISQLKEIMSVLNIIHTNSAINTNTLRELFLLYIPINYQVYKEDSNFDKITSENEESIKESNISILFETYNFSNILITLSEDNNIIIVEVHTTNEFPYEKFKSIITNLAKDNSINLMCDFLKIKEYGNRGQKQNFKIISNDFISLNVLNISHIIIKTVFKLDYDSQAAIEA